MHTNFISNLTDQTSLLRLMGFKLENQWENFPFERIFRVTMKVKTQNLSEILHDHVLAIYWIMWYTELWHLELQHWDLSNSFKSSTEIV